MKRDEVATGLREASTVLTRQAEFLTKLSSAIARLPEEAYAHLEAAMEGGLREVEELF